MSRNLLLLSEELLHFLPFVSQLSKAAKIRGHFSSDGIEFGFCARYAEFTILLINKVGHPTVQANKYGRIIDCEDFSFDSQIVEDYLILAELLALLFLSLFIYLLILIIRGEDDNGFLSIMLQNWVTLLVWELFCASIQTVEVLGELAISLDSSSNVT